MLLAVAVFCAANSAMARRGGGGFGIGGGLGRRGPPRRQQPQEDDEQCGDNEMYRTCRTGREVRPELTCERAQAMHQAMQDYKENGGDRPRLSNLDLEDCEEKCICKKGHYRNEDGECVRLDKACMGEDWEPKRPWGNNMPGMNGPRPSQGGGPRPGGRGGRPGQGEEKEVEDDARCEVNQIYNECPVGAKQQPKEEPTCEKAKERLEKMKEAKENGEKPEKPEREMVDCVEGCRCKPRYIKNEDGVCIPMKECLGEEARELMGGNKPDKPNKPGQTRWQKLRDALRNRLNNSS